MKIALVVALIALALLVRRYRRNYSFTAWVVAGVGAALCFPEAFRVWGGVKLTVFIVPLTQLIMFGMGTTVGLADFIRVGKEPWPVLVGVFLQFAVMPLTGYLLARGFGLEGELAAGVILIGSCSGGLASNLMCYLAGANVALSVTMTCISTFLAPLVTPLAMQWLAGSYLRIEFLPMMLGVMNIIIVPVVAGIAANAMLFSRRPWAGSRAALAALGGGFLLLAGGTAALPAALAAFRGSVTLGLALLGLVALTKLVVTLWLGRGDRWLHRALPLVSMSGIWAILIIITAQTREVFLQVGATLVLIAILHNAAGYVLGYWLARGTGTVAGRAGHALGWFPTPAPRLSETDCRTVAFEVGMQNGGMGSGLAVEVLKSHVAALPSNVFGSWMNISASLLANYWRQRPATAPVPGPRDRPPGSLPSS